MQEQEDKKLEQFDWDTKSTYDSFLRSAAEFFVEIVKVVIISLAIIIPVRYFLIQPFYVKGASMEPSFYDNEYLIINEISYRFTNPERGDIVVFRYPKDPRQYFIKRVIGLPGEKIKIKDSRIFVYNDENPDGVAINEEIYLPDETRTSGNKEVELGTDEYYLLGDNREYSLDSRNFGPVSKRLIVGKVWLRGWPFDRISVFSAPVYDN